jgi:cobalt-zinc-cadmium efflux system outer membrane protein
LAATKARPAGEASLTVENIGTGELSGIDALETTLSYGQTIQSSERVDARSLVAHELNEIDRLQWNERRRTLFAEATRRFIDVAASQADLAAAHEQVELAITIETTTRERFENAVGTPADVARAHHARVVAEIEAEHIEHTLLSARYGLSLLWNADTPDFETVAADLDSLPPVASYDTLAARLKEAPSQALFASITRLKRAEESLARTLGGRGLPGWTAGIRRLEAVDSWGLVFGLNYAWPESELSSARAAESKAQREFTEIESETALIEARQVLFELTQELGHARIEHEAAVNELIPAARSWLDDVEAGMSTARFAVREVLEAQTAVVEARRHKISAAAEYHRTLAAIETLLGGSAAAQP